LIVTAFSSGAAATAFPDLYDRHLVTASASACLPFLKQPVLIYLAMVIK